MKTKGIEYKAGYKYQLSISEYPLMLPIAPGDEIFHYNRNTEIISVDDDMDHVKCGPFLALWPSGKMRIYEGYAWDGPSGPAFDTPNFMTPSMVHDALYQLMRNRVIPRDPFRAMADEIMYQMCKRRGMCGARAWWCKRGVVRFGAKAATKKRPILRAP